MPWQHLTHINVIFDSKHIFWRCWKIRKITERRESVWYPPSMFFTAKSCSKRMCVLTISDLYKQKHQHLSISLSAHASQIVWELWMVYFADILWLDFDLKYRCGEKVPSSEHSHRSRWNTIGYEAQGTDATYKKNVHLYKYGWGISCAKILRNNRR